MDKLALALTAIDKIIQLCKSLSNTKKDIKTRETISEIQGEMFSLYQTCLSAQQEEFNSQKRIRDLELKIEQYEKWDTEKEKYEPCRFETGSTAYKIKVSNVPVEKSMYFCANCYDNRKRSILQPEEDAFGQYLGCPQCKTRIMIGKTDWSNLYKSY